MPRMIASRNLRICTKDCMCLYVCPTGATDTETGQIDFSRCVGCGDCARSCPNSAGTTDDPNLQVLMKAVRRSERLMGEDLIRETGYLLPQSGEVRRMLESFVANPPEGFPVEAAKELLSRMRFNS